jgi:NAD(P)-dependent dehydrogenase (short-subunit alcohol dehydrogenase family)
MLDTGRWENFHRRKRRLAEAEREDVAAEVLLRAVLFLAEPAASFVTGESVGVWGGSFMF